MLDFIIIFLFTLVITFVVNKTNHIRIFSLIDKIDNTQTRKIHVVETPKTGGISIFISLLLIGSYFYIIQKDYSASLLLKILIVSLPIFVMAVYEDKFQNIPPQIRLIIISIVSLLAFFILDGIFKRTGIVLIDHYILSFTIFSLIATVIAYSGLINAINIIDGLNGLAILQSLNSYLVIYYLSSSYELNNINSIAFLLIAINLGVLVFNFPIAKLFLGDNGAYLNGFYITTLILYLVNDNKTISPFLPLLICAFPVVETLLSMYRRFFILKQSPLKADATHMHYLIYKKVKKRFSKKLNLLNEETSFNIINSTSAILVYTIFILPTNLGLLFYSHTIGLIVFFIGYCILYSLIYKKLIHHNYLKRKKNIL